MPSPFDGYALPADYTYAADEPLFGPLPPLHDPGNGARVRDVSAFLTSRFSFAERAASINDGPNADPLPVEFAKEEIREMLREVLPEECALVSGLVLASLFQTHSTEWAFQILWYNKSRRASRICPSCHRLYNLGDILRELCPSPDPTPPPSPETEKLLRREQEISGLCKFIRLFFYTCMRFGVLTLRFKPGSPLCFILASFSHHQPPASGRHPNRNPEGIRGAWGRMAEDMDDDAWLALGGDSPIYPELEEDMDSASSGTITDGHPAPQHQHEQEQSELAKALGLIVRMTRLHDLGLGQIFFPDVAAEELE